MQRDEYRPENRLITGIVISCSLAAGCDWLLGFEDTKVNHEDADAIDGDCVDGSHLLDCGPLDLAVERMVFRTDGNYPGFLDGLAGADTICQVEAEAQNLAGRWLAWLGDTSSSPDDRFVHGLGPYVRVKDNIPIATDWNDLVDGTLLAPVLPFDADTVPPSPYVWTNVTPTGVVQGTEFDDHCRNWFFATQYSGRVGDATATDGNWTAHMTLPCNAAEAGLYCFQQ